MLQVNDGFQSQGFTSPASRVDALLNAEMSAQKKADLMVADVVSAARAWAKGGKRNGLGRCAQTGRRSSGPGEVAGVTPDMLVRAMYRPSTVIKDSKEAGSVMLVTNILTEHGPVVVEIKTTGDMDGQQAAIIRSAHAREHGAIADWVNGKDAARQVLYIDPLQIGESMTGNLNPENQNATRKGWRVVPATGEINDFRPNAWGPTSPTSDKPSIAKWGTPANIDYRGLRAVNTPKSAGSVHQHFSVCFRSIAPVTSRSTSSPEK